MKRLSQILGCGFACLACLAAQPVAADSYEVDAVHSSITFSVMHMDLNPISGQLSEAAGSFTTDAKSEIKLSANLESIDTGNKGRDDHLKSPDFFSAKQFPRIEFVSKAIHVKNDQTLEISGELKLHGISKPLTVTAKTTHGKGRGGEARAGFVSSFTIKRSDFKVGPAGGLGDDVNVTVSLQGVAK